MIWSYHQLKLVNNETITEYCISPLNSVHELVSSNSNYSHTLACYRQFLKLFGQGKSED